MSSGPRVLMAMAHPGVRPGLSGMEAVPPAGFLHIAGYLLRQRPDMDIRIRDFGAENLSLDAQVRAVREVAPDILATSARSFLFPGAVRLAQAVKEAMPAVRIVAGGQHITLSGPGESYPDCFDTVVFGEGELAMERLCAMHERGEDWPRTMQGGFLERLEHVPAWHLLESADCYRRAYTPLYTDSIGSVVWSRGCPFNCFFCAGPGMWTGSKPRVRYRTPYSVAQELSDLVSLFGVRRLFVHDDTLNASLSAVRPILEEIVRRDLPLQWGAAGLRANESLTPPWLFDLLWKAGCRYVSFGVESGDPEVLKKINRKVTLEEVERALALARERGFKTCAGFTIGHVWVEPDGTLDGEREHHLARTVDYMRSLLNRGLLWSIQMSVVTPIPGAPLYDCVKDRGLLRYDDLQELGNDDRLRLLFDHPHLTEEMVDRHYKAAYRAVSVSPRHVLRLLRGVRDLGDLLGLVRTGLFVVRQRLMVH